MKSLRMSALAVGLVLLAATLSRAQEAGGDSSSGPDRGIEEIMVIGEMSETSTDFADADAVTGFSADELAALGVQDVSDLAGFTPNLEIVTGGSTTPTFFIRGVGLNDFNSNSTGAVAIYQDDVAINAPALQLGTLFDMEAVNILRGPQGTGFGRNASAGAIKLYSKKPSGDFGGYIRTDFGNFGYQDYEGAFEAPLFEDILSARFAFRLSERDGVMKNRCGSGPNDAQKVPFPGGPGGFTVDAPFSHCGEPVRGNPRRPGISDIPPGLEDYVNNLDNWAGRVTMLFEPTLDFSVTLNGHGSARDELTRLGQSYGTFGAFCIGGDICTGRPPGDPSLQGTISSGVLGGPQGNNGYQTPEVRARLIELSPCFADNSCFIGLPGPAFDARRAQANRAQITVANELARDLDDEPWEGDFNRTGSTTNDTFGGYLKTDTTFEWGGGIQLITTSGFDGYNRSIDSDLDFSPETLFQIRTDDEGWQFYQDLRLQGELGGADISDTLIRWDVGGWFLRERLDVSVANDLGDQQSIGVGSREYVQDGYSAGGYANLAFDFWEDFTLDGGFRYNWDQKDLDYVLLAGGGGGPEFSDLSETWQAPTGTIRLTYRFREDTHAFWKYTRGWKPGTYNATSAQNRPITVPEPEQIDAFETGISGRWFDEMFGIDASLFYYAYEDYQIFTTQQFLGGNTEFVILNASDAEVYGAEIDATARPWPGAFGQVRFAWLESQFLDFIQTNQQLLPGGGGGGGLVFQEVQNSGNPLLNSPRFKVSLTAEQTVDFGRYGALSLRYDGVWTDDTFYDATNGRGTPNLQLQQFLPELTLGQPAFWLHNLRLGWKAPNGQIEIAGWVRNLENTPYKTFAFDASSFQNTTIFFVGDPRTFGASVVVTF